MGTKVIAVKITAIGKICLLSAQFLREPYNEADNKMGELGENRTQNAAYWPKTQR